MLNGRARYAAVSLRTLRFAGAGIRPKRAISALTEYRAYDIIRRIQGRIYPVKKEIWPVFSQIDEKYYYPGNDLGAVYFKDKTEFKVWAPLAEKITALLYHTCRDEKPYRRLPMEKHKNGTWSKTAFGDLNGVYYTYMIVQDGIERETIDIYAKSAGADGAMGQVIDLKSCNPAGWDAQTYVKLESYTDACIYELHVRDFSIDPSGNFCYKGRFLAFIEKGLVNAAGDKIGIDHLKELGVTHVQLLPCFDFESVKEADFRRPQFNWGYDPMNFNVPEGSYSTDPFNGRTRVAEFKRLVYALHKEGIGVIMDVVYNHTGSTAGSCFDKTFPKYYYRFSGENVYSNASGCGNEVATERAMVRKYIIDSLVYWTSEYKIDGFRFDLMGIYDIETINEIRSALIKINPDVILYGEGWTGGDSPISWEKRAMKLKARHTPGIGYFSDDFRDTVKGGTFENKSRGYVNGQPGMEYFIREIITGRVPHKELPNLSKFAWTDDPSQTVNYVEAHDNLTLWDKLSYTNPTDSAENRMLMDKLAAAMVFLSQGIPFIQAGQDFLRSKPLPGGAFDHNSYKSPDSINSIKWDRKSEYRNVFDYYKGLIGFRKRRPALRMRTGAEVSEHLKFISNLPRNVVGFKLFGDKELEEIIVFFNANDYPVKLFAFEKYDVYIDGGRAGTEPLYSVEGEYEVGKISAIVLGR